VTDHLKHLLAQEGAENRSSLRRSTGAKASARTRKGEKVLTAAAITVDPSKAPIQIPTVGESEHHIVHEASPAPVDGLEALLPGPFDLVVAFLNQTVQR
jgi:hypothetical protein